jgi:hypothetical protein
MVRTSSVVLRLAVPAPAPFPRASGALDVGILIVGIDQRRYAFSDKLSRSLTVSFPSILWVRRPFTSRWRMHRGRGRHAEPRRLPYAPGRLVRCRAVYGDRGQNLGSMVPLAGRRGLEASLRHASTKMTISAGPTTFSMRPCHRKAPARRPPYADHSLRSQSTSGEALRSASAWSESRAQQRRHKVFPHLPSGLFGHQVDPFADFLRSRRPGEVGPGLRPGCGGGQESRKG